MGTAEDVSRVNLRKLDILRWKLLDLLRWIMWDKAAPPWQEFQEDKE